MNVWIERISALYRNLMRTFANEQGLQLVHVEIMQFLNSCNRYSNTVQALSDYFGQTKGSISQSVSLLETTGFISKNQSTNDKRVFHLNLTPKGRTLIASFADLMTIDLAEEAAASLVFEQTLRALQKKNKLKEFGICQFCGFNQDLGDNKFLCGLTKEALIKSDVDKICGEYKKKS